MKLTKLTATEQDLADDLATMLRVSRLVPMERDHWINEKCRFMARLIVEKYSLEPAPASSGSAPTGTPNE